MARKVSYRVERLCLYTGQVTVITVKASSERGARIVATNKLGWRNPVSVHHYIMRED